MRLQCIRDMCAKSGDWVDWRKCCKCEEYHGQERMATVECSHILAEHGTGQGYQGDINRITPMLCKL